MKRLVLLFVLVFCMLFQATPQTYVLRSVVTYIEDNEPPPEVSPQDEAVYLSLEDELIICIAYVEDYYSRSYFCGSRWTIGYGSTYYSDGTPVRPYEHIDKLTAQKCVRTHLRKRVFPYINKYIKKELSRREMIATCMFVYNIGSGNFKKSSFLRAVNKGLSPIECARRMTEFTKSAGKTAPGLLKRSWIQAAIYCGYITPYDLLELKPAGFYNYPVSTFCTKGHDGYYNYDFSSKKLNKFKKDNYVTKRRVIDIIS